MNIVYLISIVLLFLSIMLIKKVNRKINFIGSFLITIIAFICFQAIVAYCFDAIKIPITLLNMSIINIAVTVILWTIHCLKIRKFQSYTVKKYDILFLFILFVINIPILYKEFGLLENFRYISTDAVMHCQAAMTFSKSDFLLDSMTNWEAINPTFMIASYVNDGMLMKALVDWIGEFNLYKVYMFTDMSYYIMIGYLFYLFITSSKLCNKKIKYVLAYVVSILFMIGYPLNSIITGFHYFTLGILEFIAILYIIKTLYRDNNVIMCIILFLLNTGIMLTYNMIAPIIYLTQFIYFVYKIKCYKERIFTKENLLGLLFIFIIPGLIGTAFFFLPRVFGHIVLENQQQLWIDGYIYTNYWSNMVVFIPFVLYYIFHNTKKNKIDLETITFFVIAIFMLLLFIGKMLGYVSVYYFMKPYFLLNAILFFLLFYSICTIIDINKIGKSIAIIFTILYSMVLIINLLFINVGAYDFKKYHESGKTIFDIYNSNKAIMKLIQNTFTEDRIDTLEYVYSNELIEKQNLLYLGDYIDNFLFKMFFTYENREGIDKRKCERSYSKVESRRI